MGTYRDSPQFYRKSRYQWSLTLAEDGEYREALAQFAGDMEYEGAEDGIRRIYKLASQEGKMGVTFDAAAMLRDFEGIARLSMQVVSAGRNHLLAMRRDGTVVAAGNDDERQCDVQDWTDIVTIYAGNTTTDTVGVKADEPSYIQEVWKSKSILKRFPEKRTVW